MPRTNVFSGSSYDGDHNGGVGVEGKKDKARITFTDRNRNKSTASFQVYTKAKLITSRAYRRAEGFQSENLVNQWITRRDHNVIIKYAGLSEQAFVFEMDNKSEENADLYFDLLIKSGQLNYIDYFKEL